MEPAKPVGTTPARTDTAPAAREALAGALPAWDLLPDAPVRRK